VPGRSAITAGQARALLKQMDAEALADEAEQAAHGVRHLTAGPATLNPPAPQRSCCGMLRPSASW
jgi:hypothetical protein